MAVEEKKKEKKEGLALPRPGGRDATPIDSLACPSEAVRDRA